MNEVAPASFRFPETKSAHLKFSPLSDNNLWRLIMFARNISFHLKSNMLSDYARTLENEILPLLRKQKGFKDELTLSNPGTVDVITISLWENKADADAYNTNAYQQVLKTVARMIDGTPKVQTFEEVTSTFHNSLVAV
jgi:quinol monooxygenase YgiN